MSDKEFNRELAELRMAAAKSTRPIQVRYTIWAQAEPTRTGQRWRYCSEQQPEVPVIPPTGIRVSADPEDNSCLFFEQRTAPRADFSARYGAYAVGDGWYWYLDLTAPHALPAPAPEPGPVVFVLDASRSQEEAGGLALQLEIVSAYLAHTPKAEVELVIFNRSAERVFGRFVSASAFARSLPRDFVKRPLRNGSFLDKGLELAARALVARGKPGRIVLLSDGELRSQFSTQDAVSILDEAPQPTFVHHVEPYPTTQTDCAITHSTVRSDLHELATRFGGAAYVLEVAKQDGSHSLRKLVKRLVWPDRIESLHLRSLDKSRPNLPIAYRNLKPDELPIADGHAQWSGLFHGPLPDQLILEGWIWGRKIELPLRINPTFERRLPRLATAEFEMTETADYETRPCQHVGASVQDALAGAFLTRGVVFWVPGEGGPLTDGEGTISDPRCHGHVIGKGGSRLSTSPPQDPLFPDAQSTGVEGAAQALAVCGLTLEPAGDIKGVVETMGREIVDVTLQGGPEQARHCIEESLWNILLPPDFNKKVWSRRQTYAFALSPLR